MKGEQGFVHSAAPCSRWQSVVPAPIRGDDLRGGGPGEGFGSPLASRSKRAIARNALRCGHGSVWRIRLSAASRLRPAASLVIAAWQSLRIMAVRKCPKIRDCPDCGALAQSEKQRLFCRLPMTRNARCENNRRCPRHRAGGTGA